jgi:hypothetical protein
MSAKNELRKYAVEWIESRAKCSVFHLYDLYKYLETEFPEECEDAGITVSDGKPYYEFAARDAIRRIRETIGHARRGRYRRGHWRRI